jgi:hypothetical protein
MHSKAHTEQRRRPVVNMVSFGTFIFCLRIEVTTYPGRKQPPIISSDEKCDSRSGIESKSNYNRCDGEQYTVGSHQFGCPRCVLEEFSSCSVSKRGAIPRAEAEVEQTWSMVQRVPLHNLIPSRLVNCGEEYSGSSGDLMRGSQFH